MSIEKQKQSVIATINMAITNYKSRMASFIDTNRDIPEASGELKESGIEVINRSKALGIDFEAWYGFAAEHAEDAESGRSPGRMPPINEIELWCMYVGIPQIAAFNIARKIAKYGTEGHFFYNRGEQFAKQVLRDEFTRAISANGLEGVVYLT